MNKKRYLSNCNVIVDLKPDKTVISLVIAIIGIVSASSIGFFQLQIDLDSKEREIPGLKEKIESEQLHDLQHERVVTKINNAIKLLDTCESLTDEEQTEHSKLLREAMVLATLKNDFEQAEEILEKSLLTIDSCSVSTSVAGGFVGSPSIFIPFIGTPPSLIHAKNMTSLEGGFTINESSFNVESYVDHFPTFSFNVNEPITVTAKFYDDQGPGDIEHVTLAIIDKSIGQFVYFAPEILSMKWDQESGVILDDPDQLLQNVDVSSSWNSDDTVSVTFSFEITQELSAHRIRISASDSSDNFNVYDFPNIIQVTDEDASSLN